MLLVMHLGFTKHMCFLCHWNSPDDKNHLEVKEWPARSDYIVGRHNVKREMLKNPQNIYLPQLYINHGFIKNYVKANVHDRSGFL